MHDVVVDFDSTTDNVPTKALIARRVYFSGDVQGVGFRYRTREVARAFPVSGYVRNLSNGEVELTVEGGKSAVVDFLTAVERRMRTHIKGVRSEDIPISGHYEGFVIEATGK